MNIQDSLQDRFDEIDAYFEMLGALDENMKQKRPRFEGSQHEITSLQQRVMYSSVYLQLYNLVEATVTTCVEAVESAVQMGSHHKPADLSEPLLKAWVKHTTQAHKELSSDKRLERALTMCQALISDSPIGHLKITRGGGGNWDDLEIERIAKDLGVSLQLNPNTKQNVKRFVRDELGPLGLIKKLRNNLAHGKISFGECAQNASLEDLSKLKQCTFAYLVEVIQHFEDYITNQKYIEVAS